MNGSILSFNSRSSSVKFASFDIALGLPPKRILHGEVEGIGSRPRLRAWEHDGATLDERPLNVSPRGAGLNTPAYDHDAALGTILTWLSQHPLQGQPVRSSYLASALVANRRARSEMFMDVPHVFATASLSSVT
jgi:hypothetical protein